MEESYDERVANPIGLESCAFVYEAVMETSIIYDFSRPLS
jgi:hypothetical protein